MPFVHSGMAPSVLGEARSRRNSSPFQTVLPEGYGSEADRECGDEASCLGGLKLCSLKLLTFRRYSRYVTLHNGK